MRISIKVGLLFAALWIVIKLSMFGFGMLDSQIPGTLTNIFCLLAAISVGLFMSKLRREEKGSALTDIKEGMSAGLPYTLIVSIFIYFFYGSIDAQFTEHKISERLAGIEKTIEIPGKWEKFKREHTDFETYSKVQYMKEEKEKIEAANSPKAIFVMSLLGGLMLGTFYSILVTAIFRKIVFR